MCLLSTISFIFGTRIKMLLLKKSESQIVEEAIGLVHAYGGEFKAHLHVAINFYFGLLYLRDKVSSDVIFELSVMGNTIWNILKMLFYRLLTSLIE